MTDEQSKRHARVLAQARDVLGSNAKAVWNADWPHEWAQTIADLVEEREVALRIVRAASLAYDGFGEDDHRFYGSQKRLAEALSEWRGSMSDELGGF